MVARRGAAGCAGAGTNGRAGFPGRGAGPEFFGAARSFGLPEDGRLLDGRPLVLALEAFDASSGVHQLLFAGKEGMAMGADFDVDVALVGRAGLEGFPASTDDTDFIVNGMDFGLHRQVLKQLRLKAQRKGIIADGAGVGQGKRGAGAPFWNAGEGAGGGLGATSLHCPKIVQTESGPPLTGFSFRHNGLFNRHFHIAVDNSGRGGGAGSGAGGEAPLLSGILPRVREETEGGRDAD